MTELEKCQQGLMYDTTFPDRDSDNLRCLDLCHAFNQMKPSDLAGREAMIRKILHKVGKNVRVEQNVFISFGYHIEAGDDLFVNHNCVFLDPAKITFGDRVFIGPCCGFYTAHHPIDRRQRGLQYEYAFPITVGNDVWFGGHCCVLPGVTIGSDVVIGAGSVVVHDIPDHVVAAGNPCRVIREITDADRGVYHKSHRSSPSQEIPR